MAINTEELIEALAIICQKKDLKASVKGCATGAVITGFSTALGGLLLGPVGLALGGIVGGSASAILTKNKVQALGTIIRNLSLAEKQLLCQKVHNALKDVAVEDLYSLAMLIVTQASVREIAQRVVVDFLSSHLNIMVQ